MATLNSTTSEAVKGNLDRLVIRYEPMIHPKCIKPKPDIPASWARVVSSSTVSKESCPSDSCHNFTHLGSLGSGFQCRRDFGVELRHMQLPGVACGQSEPNIERLFEHCQATLLVFLEQGPKATPVMSGEQYPDHPRRLSREKFSVREVEQKREGRFIVERLRTWANSENEPGDLIGDAPCRQIGDKSRIVIDVRQFAIDLVEKDRRRGFRRMDWAAPWGEALRPRSFRQFTLAAGGNCIAAVESQP